MLVTVCSRERSPLLTVGAVPRLLATGIVKATRDVPVAVLAWVIMPDHLHVLLAPKVGGDVQAWVRRLKGGVSSHARALGLRRLWQRSFHDRVLRSDEQVSQVARYVLQNPVRAGWVEAWHQWPHHGSLTWDLCPDWNFD